MTSFCLELVCLVYQYVGGFSIISFTQVRACNEMENQRAMQISFGFRNVQFIVSIVRPRYIVYTMVKTHPHYQALLDMPTVAKTSSNTIVWYMWQALYRASQELNLATMPKREKTCSLSNAN